jgi:signal transduction histidine kinase
VRRAATAISYTFIERNAKAPTRIIDDFLNIARIVRNIRMNPQPVDLVAVIQGARCRCARSGAGALSPPPALGEGELQRS